MISRIIILVLTITALGGLVYYMYDLSLQYESENPFGIVPSGEPVVIPPSSFSSPIVPVPEPVEPSVAPLAQPTVPPKPAVPNPPPVATPPVIPVSAQPIVPPKPVVPEPAPSPQLAAKLSLYPQSNNVKPGKVFPVEILLDTGGVSVVAVKARLIFNDEYLSVDRVDFKDSVFPIEAERIIHAGEATITRGKQTPGYSGTGGNLATIYFKAKASGSGDIQIEFKGFGQGPSRVISDDGRGTDILSEVISASYKF